MSLTAHDVMLVEGLVEGDGLGEAFDGVGDALLEPAAPELGLLGLRGLGLCGAVDFQLGHESARV